MSSFVTGIRYVIKPFPYFLFLNLMNQNGKCSNSKNAGDNMSRFHLSDLLNQLLEINRLKTTVSLCKVDDYF